MNALLTTTGTVAPIMGQNVPQEEEEDEEGGRRRRRREGDAPKKRAIALTAYLACLSFLIFFINALVALVNSVLQNEQIWTMLNDWSKVVKNGSYNAATSDVAP